MSRAFHSTLAVALSLGACGSEPTRSTVPAPPTVDAPKAELLPAGVYWYGYKTCERCPKPAFATASFAKTIERAAELVAEPPAGLPLGYPLVVHSNQIKSTATAGILVIYGLHQDEAGADSWLAYQARLGVASSKYTIEGDTEPPMIEGAQVVSRVIAGGAVAAYNPDDIAAAETAAYETMTAPTSEAVAKKLRPMCRVQAGEVFLATETELEWYRWAPVRCGDKPALILWRHSLLGNAVVIRRRDGFVLRQVTAVECDMPSYQEWSYSRAGKSDSKSVDPPAGC